MKVSGRGKEFDLSLSESNAKGVENSHLDEGTEIVMESNIGQEEEGGVKAKRDEQNLQDNIVSTVISPTQPAKVE